MIIINQVHFEGVSFHGGAEV